MKMNALLKEYVKHCKDDYTNLIYLEKKYGKYFNKEGKQLYNDFIAKRDAFIEKAYNLLEEDFIVVSSQVNANNRIVRKYISSHGIRTYSDLEKQLQMLPNITDKVYFAEITYKELSKITLSDNHTRTLSGRFTDAVNLMAAEKGVDKLNSVMFIIGVNVAKIRDTLGFSNENGIFNFADYKLDKEPTAKISAFDLPLFKDKNNTDMSYNQAVANNCIFAIQTGTRFLNRDGAEIKVYDRCFSVERLMKKLYDKLGNEQFNRKIVLINWGNYKKIQKFITGIQLPLWPEVLKYNITSQDVETLYNYSCPPVVKDTQSNPLSYYPNRTIDTIKKVAVKYFDGKLTKKQQTLLEDLEYIKEIEDNWYNVRDYQCKDYANLLNRMLELGVDLNKNNADIDLHLKEKYPYMINGLIAKYELDNEDVVKSLLDIVEAYPTEYQF